MSDSAAFSGRYYTLERDNRELQHYDRPVQCRPDYTLERDNRELQPVVQSPVLNNNYTLERDNRELQRP